MQRSGGARPDEVPEQPPMVTFPAGTHDGHVAPVVGPRSARRAHVDPSQLSALVPDRPLADSRPALGTNLYNVEWNAEEQSTLEAGMQCISTERVSALSRYIKIAATLPEKSVRDVALRVRWMMRKDAPRKPRHKSAPVPVEAPRAVPGPAKRSRSGAKEARPEIVRPSSAQGGRRAAAQPSRFAAPRGQLATANAHASSLGLNALDLFHYPPSPLRMLAPDDLAGPLGRRPAGSTLELLDANVGLAHVIKSKLESSQVMESTHLLCTFRDNILAILHRMSTQTGIMAQMPPLPVRPNLELADAILSCGMGSRGGL